MFVFDTLVGRKIWASNCPWYNEYMNKQRLIDELAIDIVSHDVCRELRQSATQLVMGSGNLDANIVIIGEAPGKQEDIQGAPFVGASGKFLNELLESISLSRDEVYITNIVKYRPPNNRDPTKQEKAEFWPYLLTQLQIINPKVVVTLGRHSMEYFLPNKAISAVHGQPESVKIGDHTIVVVPLYHPAAALYNRAMRQVLIDDFMRVPAIVAQVTRA